MKTPYTLVIVPFKGQVDYLVKFCESLLSKSYVTGMAYAVVLYDDGSTTSELDYLYENTKKWKPLIVRNENVGYTKAVHTIFDTFCNYEKVFDYLLLANSDVKLNPGTMYSMVKRMNYNANTAVVGGKILKYDTDEIIHTGTRVENDKIVDPYVGLKINDPSTNFVERRLWVNGCCCLYNLHIMRKENLNVDLEFSPAYFEEADLMTRMNVLGYSVLYEPRAEIHHVVNATMGNDRPKYEKVFWANWQRYLDKWKSRFPELEF